MEPIPREPDSSEIETYFQEVDIYDYDETIVAHPLMDQIKAAICERVLRKSMASNRPIRILDLGCGSGQVARLLMGLTDVEVHLCDPDPESAAFCQHHSELKGLKFHQLDILQPHGVANLAREQFDVVVALGVLHHIPPNCRPLFLRNCAAISKTLIVADEGLASYSNEMERRENARTWYDFVIEESRRRGLHKLALLEQGFKASDLSSERREIDDYKTSIECLESFVKEASLSIGYLKMVGNWEKHKGGMYLAEIANFQRQM